MTRARLLPLVLCVAIVAAALVSTWREDEQEAQAPVPAPSDADPDLSLVSDLERPVLGRAPVPGADAGAATTRASVGEWRGPVERRLVDAATGEPVPQFALGFPHGVPLDARPIMTDDEGRFRTTGSYSEGELEVVLLDTWGMPAWTNRALKFPHGPASAGDDLPIPVGPTYHLNLELEGGQWSNGLSAMLLAGETGATAELNLVQRGSSRGIPFALPDTVRVELVDDRMASQTGSMHRAAVPWVRFAALTPEFAEHPGPWALRIRNGAGTWIGEAPVDSIVGVQPRRVHMTLTALAELEVDVECADGHALAMRATLRRGQDVTPPALDELLPLGASSFSFHGLVPGPYVLFVGAEDHETQAFPVFLPGDETMKLRTVIE